MSEPVLHIRLSAGYGKATVLHDVSLDLYPGDSVGLAGTSGAGKSTLVLALLGLLPWRKGWARGEVRLAGSGGTRNLLTLSEREARALRGRDIALVPQSPVSALNPALNLRTQLSLAWKAHQRDASGFLPRVQQLFAEVQLPGDESFLARRPGEISVGQAQRVVLALALLHRPAVLIADEPTSSLDPATQREVLELFRTVVEREHTTLLYISHDLLSVLQLCRHVAILETGRIVAHEAVDSLHSDSAHPALQSLLRTLPAPVAVLLPHLRAGSAVPAAPGVMRAVPPTGH